MISLCPTRAGNRHFLLELLVYLKNCPPRFVLLFLTMVWNSKIYNLKWGEKNMIFLIMFHDFRFGFWIVTTHLKYKCLKCIFHTKNCIIEKVLYNANSVAEFFYVEKTLRALVFQMCGNCSKKKFEIMKHFQKDI